MDELARRRLIVAAVLLLALAAWSFLPGPGGRLKAGLRADAEGFSITLEYVAEAAAPRLGALLQSR